MGEKPFDFADFLRRVPRGSYQLALAAVAAEIYRAQGIEREGLDWERHVYTRKLLRVIRYLMRHELMLDLSEEEKKEFDQLRRDFGDPPNGGPEAKKASA